MSLWIQIKYFQFLPLDQKVQTDHNKWNFRCPVCGDSDESATKKRGWAYEWQGQLVTKCFNCPWKGHFNKFIKEHFPFYYPDYIKELMGTKSDYKKFIPKPDLFATDYDKLSLSTLDELPTNHIANKYLNNRLIPKKFYKDFYYTDNFAHFLNTKIKKGAIKIDLSSDKRIVFPFRDKYNKIFAVSGRSLEFKFPKYLNYKMIKDCDLLFGLDRVDFTKKIFVTEGILDSLFLPNSLAVSGALGNVKNLLKYTNIDNIIIIPDNDRNNKQTKKFIENNINMGFKILIWPKNIKFKDINEGFVLGMSLKELAVIIKHNVFSGLMAFTKFKTKGSL